MIGLQQISNQMLRNYVARYEAGGVQTRPHLRFVDRRGRACVAGAFAGASTSKEFASTEACRTFLEGPLLAISRMFENGRVTAADVYRECLLELATRDADREAETAERKEIGRVAVLT